MKVIKEENSFGEQIYLEEDDKNLGITYGGNLDLYWTIHSKDCENHENFIITKENYGIYRLFEKLFYDIENMNIFEDEIPYFFEEYDEDKEYKKYRYIYGSNYNELFNKDTNTITWYSDETAHEVANYLTIKKEEDIFALDFYTQPHIEGYDRDFNTKYSIPIRFRTSGSRYDPFHIIFMRMYNHMKEVDDVMDNGHQITFEEYLYNQEKTIKLTKK